MWLTSSRHFGCSFNVLSARVHDEGALVSDLQIGFVERLEMWNGSVWTKCNDGFKGQTTVWRHRISCSIHVLCSWKFCDRFLVQKLCGDGQSSKLVLFKIEIREIHLLFVQSDSMLRTLQHHLQHALDASLFVRTHSSRHAWKWSAMDVHESRADAMNCESLLMRQDHEQIDSVRAHDANIENSFSDHAKCHGSVSIWKRSYFSFHVISDEILHSLATNFGSA